MSAGSAARNSAHPPSFWRPNSGEDQRADDEDQRLDRFGVGDGPHAADDRVEARQQHHRHRADPEAVERHAANVEAQLRHQGSEDDAAGEDPHGDLGEHVGDQRNDRQHPPRRRREPALQELRHRVDLRPHVEGHEDPPEHEQAPGVEFVMRHRHAARRARAGQADQVLGADVRGEDRSADDQPAQVAPGQEVVVGRVLHAPHHPGDEREQQAEVGEDDQPVECGHRRFPTDLRCALSP